MNNATGQVVYGNTSAFSDFSIAENAPGSFNFTLPSKTDTGDAMLYVVADGIASVPLPVTIH